MKKILVSSTREGAGKSSIIVGMAATLKKQLAYIKPFGDRLIYHRKINWDYDSFLIKTLWNLDNESDEMTLGFSHNKLRYMYDQESLQTAVTELAASAGKAHDTLMIEGGKDLRYGSSIHFDSLSIAKYLQSQLVLVASGDGDTIVDDIEFIKNLGLFAEDLFEGIIINKVKDLEDFENTHLESIKNSGVKVLGIIPYKEQLTHFTMQFLAEKFFAKVISGDQGMQNKVENIFVGAMSTEESLRNPLFNKEHKLLITSGDRSDMILSALDSDTAGIILSNNILPPANIIARASEQGIPILLVTSDTYHVARQMDNFEALLTPTDNEKINLLAQLVAKYVSVGHLLN